MTGRIGNQLVRVIDHPRMVDGGWLGKVLPESKAKADLIMNTENLSKGQLFDRMVDLYFAHWALVKEVEKR